MKFFASIARRPVKDVNHGDLTVLRLVCTRNHPILKMLKFLHNFKPYYQFCIPKSTNLSSCELEKSLIIGLEIIL